LDAIRLTEYLTQNIDGVRTVLESIGYTNIQYYKSRNEFRFPRDEGRNPSSVKFNLNTLTFKCFSDNSKGNLYTLVMNKKGYKYFPEALNYIADLLGLEKQAFNNKIKLPFGGFYKHLIRELQEPELYMQTYSEDILEPYLHKYNTMFFNDGINYQTQEEFKVGYDLETNSILIPEYTFDGKLCGIQARTNDVNCDHDKRWWAWLPCSRSLTLYGWHRNYLYIQEKDLCIIPEAEKSIMKLYQMNCFNAVATCGCEISTIQAKYLKSLLVSRYIVAYDEGLDEEKIINECKKIKINNTIFTNKVGYIYDRKNQYLPKGSKLSPCDMPKDIFMKLVKECTIWLGDE
jgi:DNA primase